MSGAFNLQTGLVANNGSIPAIGTAVAGAGGSSVANVNGIVSRQGDGSTDLAVVIGAGLSYVPAGTAGGTLSATAPATANVNGVVSRQGNATTDTAVQFNNGVKYTPAATAGGLVDILPAPTADMKATATTGGEQFLSDPDGIQLRATNTPASVGGDCVFTYKNATTNYAWETPAAASTNLPIGCIIMYATNTGFTTDPAGAANGYFLNFGTECWKLCDGTTGSTPATGSTYGATPDLINKFARGINTSAPPQVLPENILINAVSTSNSTTSVSALSLANLPAHTHDRNTTAAANSSSYVYGRTSGTTTPIGGVPFLPVGLAAPQYIMDKFDTTGGITGGTNPPTAPSATTTTTTTTTAGGINIKPTSQDVLYIVRVF